MEPVLWWKLEHISGTGGIFRRGRHYTAELDGEWHTCFQVHCCIQCRVNTSIRCRNCIRQERQFLFLWRISWKVSLLTLWNQVFSLTARSIYVSSDIGVTFAKTVALGSSTVVNKIRVHPTVAGELWASTDVGLFHSVNYGATFTQIGSGVTTGYDFGKLLCEV